MPELCKSVRRQSSASLTLQKSFLVWVCILGNVASCTGTVSNFLLWEYSIESGWRCHIFIFSLKPPSQKNFSMPSSQLLGGKRFLILPLCFQYFLQIQRTVYYLSSWKLDEIWFVFAQENQGEFWEGRNQTV